LRQVHCGKVLRVELWFLCGFLRLEVIEVDAGQRRMMQIGYYIYAGVYSLRFSAIYAAGAGRRREVHK
jgi:hypothetical protein